MILRAPYEAKFILEFGNAMLTYDLPWCTAQATLLTSMQALDGLSQPSNHMSHFSRFVPISSIQNTPFRNAMLNKTN